MKCAVIGGSFLPQPLDDAQRLTCEHIGTALASLGIEVLTGACGGYPHLVSEAAIAAGGSVTGYSPGHNADEHIQIYEHPVDACTNLEFLESPWDSPKMRLLGRSLPLMHDADLALSIEGSWGTLFELVSGVVFGMPQIVFTGFGGASGALASIRGQMDDECLYRVDDQMVFTDDEDKIIALLSLANDQSKSGAPIAFPGIVKHSDRPEPINDEGVA